MLIVLDSGNGQMCNQMLMQANVLASAYKHGYKVRFYGFERYDGPLYNDNRLNNIIIEKNRLNKYVRGVIFAFYYLVKKLHLNSIHIFNCGTESVDTLLSILNSNKNVWCFGWPFYDLKALRENADLIRHYFSPNKEIAEYVSIITKQYMLYETVVGVHIRRGDYKEWRNGEFYFDDYVYKSYMDMLYSKLSKDENKRILYVIFSNEPIMLNNFKNEMYEVIGANGTAIQDFYHMMQCNYLIGPPSSYSGLASFLGHIPRHIILNDLKELELSDMHVWLQETDAWVTPI